MGNYSSDDVAALPGTSADLTHVYDATDRTNVGTDDTNYVNQTGSAGYELHQYKDSITAGNATVTWKGKSSLAPSSSKVQLQVYKVAAPAGWQDVSGAGASNNVAAADTDFTLSGIIATADYLDTGVTTFRIYQSAVTGIQLGADLYASMDGNMEYADASYWPGDATITKNNINPMGGSLDLKVVGTADQVAQGIGNTSQYISLTGGTWYRIGCKMRRVAGAGTARLYNDTSMVTVCASAEYPTDPTDFWSSGISKQTSGASRMQLVLGGTAEMYFDNVFVKPITKSSMFSQQTDLGSANCTVSVPITCPRQYEAPAGVAICMDANDPSKYIVAFVARILGYLDYIKVYKIDGTTVAELLNAAIGNGATYGAGKVLQLVNNTNALTVNYDGQQQATGLDTTGYAGTICAVFNADDANSFGAFSAASP